MPENTRSGAFERYVAPNRLNLLTAIAALSGLKCNYFSETLDKAVVGETDNKYRGMLPVLPKTARLI